MAASLTGRRSGTEMAHNLSEVSSGFCDSVVSCSSHSKCYLGMELDGRRYAGTLLFKDVTFCWFITRILKNRIGSSIKEIGELDLSFAF